MQSFTLLRKHLRSLFLCIVAFVCISGLNKPPVTEHRSAANDHYTIPSFKNYSNKLTVNALPATDTSYCGKSFRIVILGSSTAYGKGASPMDSAWVYRFSAYVKSLNTHSVVINLAVPGYTTYHVLCPSNFVPPAGRPAPDTAKNITKALSLNPDAIIINLPTNDIGAGNSLAEIKANYERTMKLAGARNIPVWVTTSQPRTNYNQAERDSLMKLRDWTYSRFGVYAIDYWSTVAESNGSINSFYNSGDGVHVNNAGHKLFYSRVVNERIIDTLCLRSTTNPIVGPPNSTKYIKVNIYGGSNPFGSTQWNNWNVGTTVKTNISSGMLKYTDGTAAPVTALLSYSQGVGDNGCFYSSTISTKMAPASVLRYASYAALPRTLTISGLSSSKKYNIEVYNSWTISNNITVLSVNGVSQTINVFENYLQKGIYTNLIPTPLGQLVVVIRSGTTYNQLNGFMITEQGSAYNTTTVTKSEASVEEDADSIVLPGELQNSTVASFKAYPNPAKDKVFVNLWGGAAEPVKLLLYNNIGSIVKEQQTILHPGFNRLEFNIGYLAKGAYMLRAQWQDSSKVVQLIKQ